MRTQSLRHRAYLALLLTAALSCGGCRELVQSEFPDLPSVPVLNSILIAGAPVQVHISLAGGIGTDELPAITDAGVELFINGAYTETLAHTGGGFYTSAAVVVPGSRYECRAKVPGFDGELSARDTIPWPPLVRGIQHIRNAGVDQEGVTYPAVRLTLAHNPSQPKYFEVLIRAETPSGAQVLPLFDTEDPVLLAEGLPIPVFSNLHMTDTLHTLQFNYTTGSSGSTNGGPIVSNLYPFRLEVRAISYAYYRYIRQLHLYETGRYPDIVGGVAGSYPLYGNVDGGYGIFAGMTGYVSDLITP